MKRYVELRAWEGVIARLNAETVDGRVLSVPDAAYWRGRVVPLLCLREEDSCLGPVRVGHVQDMEISGAELRAYGSLYLDAIEQEGLAKIFHSGDLAHAGVDLIDVVTAQVDTTTVLTEWRVSSLIIGPRYVSAWADPCGIRLVDR